MYYPENLVKGIEGNCFHERIISMFQFEISERFKNFIPNSKQIFPRYYLHNFNFVKYVKRAEQECDNMKSFCV